MFTLGDLTRVAWHGKEGERSQMIGYDPKNGSGDSFPSAEIDNKKVSCWTGIVGDRTKAKDSG